jgi:hypothetical protein
VRRVILEKKAGRRFLVHFDSGGNCEQSNVQTIMRYDIHVKDANHTRRNTQVLMSKSA